MSSPPSLLEVLADLPDPRHRCGIHHPLAAILGLAVGAMLTGCNSYQALAPCGRDKGFALAPVRGFRRRADDEPLLQPSPDPSRLAPALIIERPCLRFAVNC